MVSPRHKEIWDLCQSLAQAQGLEIFDLEIPVGPSGTLRVFIQVPKSEGVSNVSGTTSDEVKAQGVTLEQCVSVSRAILDVFEKRDEELGPQDDWLVEVSSPGVNRKLSRPEHFQGAVGERVKLVLKGSQGKRSALRGQLLSFDGKALSIEEEDTKNSVVIPFENVKEAKVDFLFR